jgi:hypothetical protein
MYRAEWHALIREQTFAPFRQYAIRPAIKSMAHPTKVRCRVKCDRFVAGPMVSVLPQRVHPATMTTNC